MSFLSWAGNLKQCRGQAALEYMIIISFALVLSAPIVLNAQTSARELRTSARVTKAKNSLNTIEDAARIVHSQGPPAQIAFTVEVPSDVNMTEIGNRYLYMQIEVGDGFNELYNVLGFNVTGVIPKQEGTYKLQARAQENYVNITHAS